MLHIMQRTGYLTHKKVEEGEVLLSTAIMLHWRECHCAMAAEEASFLGHLQFEIEGGKFVVNEVEWSAVVMKSD